MKLTAKKPKHAHRKTARVLLARPRFKGWRVIQERDGNNAPLVSYTRGTDLSGSLEGAGGIGGMLARSHNFTGVNWSTHNFYHADGNGNITYLVNSSQTLAARYRYDPFGNTISSSGTLASANMYRFSSKEVMLFGGGGGVYYYGYRWYDANLQRWLNRDPIMENGGINLYGFVSNDPVNDFDVSGLQGGRKRGGPGDLRKKSCERSGGQWMQRWQAFGYANANACASDLALSHEADFILGVIGCISGKHGPIVAGIGINLAGAHALCREYICWY